MAPVRRGTSLLVFPTKALAHDQLRALTELRASRACVAGAYDGDTGNEERAWIRRHATTVLTNPEMLHSGVLPHHDRWATFLGRLRYVVVDELHVFRGIFGIARRPPRCGGCDACATTTGPTRRSCAARPRSAQPDRLASALCGLPVEAGRRRRVAARRAAGRGVEPAAARRGDRGPGLAQRRDRAAWSPSSCASGQKTIAFCRGRRATEVVAADVRRRLPSRLRRRVAPYRGGFLAEERRAIEDQLFRGRLDGVVATSALELGIDVVGPRRRAC